MDNTEIMTIEQLKEYKLLFDCIIDGPISDKEMQRLRPRVISDYNYNGWKQGDKKLCWPSRPEGWMRSELTYCVQNMYYQLNEHMNKFIVMQKEEKIIWAFDTKFNTKFKHAGSNILLTNKGKILYIEFNLCISTCAANNINLINYEIKNHNFDIPSYAICALKMLIKNIEGQYTRFATNDGPKTNNNDFKSIYKNINEYLEQLKQEQLKEELLLNQELLLKQEQLQKELLKKKTN